MRKNTVFKEVIYLEYKYNSSRIIGDWFLFSNNSEWKSRSINGTTKQRQKMNNQGLKLHYEINIEDLQFTSFVKTNLIIQYIAHNSKYLAKQIIHNFFQYFTSNYIYLFIHNFYSV